MTMKDIELQDVGPIVRLTIPVPDGGGLVVLRGVNGSGKSHALAAVEALCDGEGRPVSRDGSIGAQVSGLGARLTVGRRTSVAGELEVSALDGEDPSLLVDPGLKNAEAADAARLKALLRLSRATVGLEEFAALVDGDAELREVCRPASLESLADVPAMASAIKRDFEAAARKHEGIADNLLSKAAGVRATLEELGGGDHGVTLVSASSADARERHTAAVRKHSAAVAERANHERLARGARDAEQALAGLADAGTDGAIETATTMVEEAKASMTDATAREADLREQLRQASADVERVHRAQAEAERALAHQEKLAAQRAVHRRTIESAKEVPATDAEAIEKLNTQVQSAALDVERWAVRERTARVRAEVEDMEEKAADASVAGARLRAAAQGTERVVLNAVQQVCGDELGLHEGRLVVNTNRGRELFSDLSHGERWRIALEIAVKAVGERGLLVVRQEAFESLDPSNRAEVDEHARRLGVVVLTAEAADGEIRAEVYRAERAAVA